MAVLLVADDNPLSVHFFNEAIALAGHDPVAAGDGPAALLLASTQAFDLMLLDARMPGIDGVQVLQAIRSGDGPNRATPSLVTTADGSADQEVWLKAGFVDVVHKPIGICDLQAMISRHLCGLASDANVLDDALAAEKTGGNATIVAALRGLFAGELETLPAEIERFALAGDRAALEGRLHRLDASAGFCGALALTAAIRELRAEMEVQSGWPVTAVARLLAVCKKTRAVLG